MISTNVVRKLALLFLMAVLVCGMAHAQSTTQGAIAGTVFDATGAAIPNATVSIHNDADGSDLTVKASESGTFRAPQLAPGTYTVTFTAANFSTQKLSQVVVQVNEVTEVDPKLGTGQTSTEVEVTAEVPVLKFDSAEFGGHLDNKEIEAIPINNRRWSTLALTTPAVVNDSNGFGLLSFRAISPLLNVVEVDGADDNQAFFAEERGRTRAGYSTSQAAVREFQVNTGVYSAEFGRAVGGVVNSVTKSGGNQIHGEAYFFNRNSSRSAIQPGATNTVFNATTNTYVTSPYRPKDNRNQYGFAVGGPLKKDKIFWFYAFDAYRRNFPGTAKANNPGAFFVGTDVATPTSCGTVNAATGAVTGSTASTADAPACLLALREAAAATPAAPIVTVTATQYTAAAAQYNAQLQSFLTDLGSVPRFGNQLINTPKLDYQLNDKEHISFLYHRLRWDSPGGVQTQGTNNYAIDTFGTDFVKLDYGVAKLDSLFTSNLTNEIRFQYGRELNDEGLQPTSTYTKNNLINSTGLAPEISLNSSVGFMFGMPYYSFRVSYPDERKWQVGDTATWVRGKHSFRFGEDIVHNYDLQNNVFEGNGFITYSTTVNYFSDLVLKSLAAPASRGCNAAGSGVATPAGGFYPCYSSYAAGFGPAVFQLSTADYGIFAQDDWKLTPTLTVNLGVRYDYENIPAPYSNLTGTAGNTLAVTTQSPSDKNNVSPRIGFAWDPFGLGKTVVRGGYGMYYGRIANAILLNAYLNTGSSLSQSTPSYTTANTAAGSLPTLAAPPTGPAPGTRTAYYFDKHFQNPYTEQFDLAVQQNLGWSNVLSVSYLGALGRELPNWINANLSPAETYNITYNVVPGTNGSCGPVTCGAYNVKAYAGKHQGGASIGAIDPTFGSVTELISNINSNYHALSVDVTNRSNKWITFDANYTWAHALDFNQTTATSASVNNWVDPFANQRVNYGNSGLNVRHRVVGWAVLNAPGIHGDSAVKYLSNGWSLRPLFQMQSGLPYSAVTSGTTPQHCYSTTYTGEADGVVGCLTPAGTGITGTSATSYLPFLGRNTFQLPRTIVLDLAIQKQFTFAEHYNLQLIGQAFNLANHENVTGVGTTGYAISTTQGGTPGATTNNLTFQPSFAAVSSVNSNYAYSPRLVQVALRLQF